MVWLAGSSSCGVVRGGSWINGPKLLRSAARYPIIASFRNDNVGFRCARFLD
ncbi:MAG: SUMF1/EgtB/PvdO family nonheme iron enzyme [Geminicoccales bacterium]